ncbi:toxin-antitoxin system TumE family protein [Halapricum salinum]|uniref:Uncharacterized protein n=1 Tax=Halapricum salinum TaxID=1457250 RepID=A0A4D6HIG8_9EURY|nr:DUF6516 family protein [Halapricum salinum]QCC52812.1 hypothetical protein DV733_16920 [Halapricum salinum]
MGGDVTVVRDETSAYDDDTVASVRVLSVPTSEQYPQGVKYAFHYGKAGAEDPVVRFDNHHGPHELHLGSETYEIEYPGLEMLYEAWRAALPPEKRIDW